jgi:hypothetical protein
VDKNLRKKYFEIWELKTNTYKYRYKWIGVGVGR